MCPALVPQPSVSSSAPRRNIFDVPASAKPSTSSGDRHKRKQTRGRVTVGAHGARLLAIAALLAALAALVLVAHALLERSHEESAAKLSRGIATHPEPPSLPRITERAQRRAPRPRPRRGRRPKKRVARRPRRAVPRPRVARSIT